MKISHVIRGDDHISNTPKQILLCNALGFTPPKFAHLPMILNSDKTKLSKRENEVSLLEYRAAGYLPEALVNFLALLGWNPGGDKEVFTLEEMQTLFDMKDVHKGGAVFDVQKLQWLNGVYIRKKDSAQLTDVCIPYLIDAGYIQEDISKKQYTITATGEPIARATIEHIIRGERDRIKTLKDIVQFSGYFFQKELSYNPQMLIWKEAPLLNIQNALAYVYDVLTRMQESDFTSARIEQELKGMIAKKKLTNGTVLWPLRVALTGLSASQGPFEVAEILGKEKTLQRIVFAQNILA
jgi:glutamyl/glutaminyl-tRNA synthetase